MIGRLSATRRRPLPSSAEPGLLGHDDPLDLADRQRLVVVGAQARVLAAPVQARPRMPGIGLSARVTLAAQVKVAGGDRAHVLRHLLLDRAGVGARALMQSKRPRRRPVLVRERS